MSRPPVLAIDLGGTKLAAALVAGATLLDRREARTDRDGPASAWTGAPDDLDPGRLVNTAASSQSAATERRPSSMVRSPCGDAAYP